MPSDLMSLMVELQASILSEYERIQARSKEDPGTAGDQGEENWAEILRGWLPPAYHVVTKGRIIDAQGNSSPQIDVLVLHPSYPKRMLSVKHYMASAVIAAFECKTTLRAEHISEAVKASSMIKSLVPRRFGSPYKELFNPPYFGLLAHSHSWKSSEVKLRMDLLDRINERQFDGVTSPWQMLDMICVADTATYYVLKHMDIGPSVSEEQKKLLKEQFGKSEGISSGYYCHWQENPETHRGSVLGQMIYHLIQHCAREDTGLRRVAEYYVHTDMVAGGLGTINLWKPNVLSKAVLDRLRKKGVESDHWSEWSASI